MSVGVPFTDLTLITRDIRPAVDRAWAGLLSSSRPVGGRSRLAFRQVLEMDVEYACRRCFALDLLILLTTIPAVLATCGVL